MKALTTMQMYNTYICMYKENLPQSKGERQTFFLCFVRIFVGGFGVVCSAACGVNAVAANKKYGDGRKGE